MSHRFTTIVLSLILVGPPLALACSALYADGCGDPWQVPCEDEKDCDGTGQPYGTFCAVWEWVDPQPGYWGCLNDEDSPNKCAPITLYSYDWGDCMVVGSGCVEDTGTSEDCDFLLSAACENGE